MVVFYKEKSGKTSVNEHHEIFIIHESRILSLTYNYEFEASRVVLSISGDRLIFGNQEITLTENQLKFSLKNKMNHFNCHFPSEMSHIQTESIKSKDFQVLNMFKYKFK